MNKTCRVILSVLENKMGIVIINKVEEDFPLTDYIPDSMTFMQFIVLLEEEIGVELSDDFLDSELMNSLFGFSEKLEDYLSISSCC